MEISVVRHIYAWAMLNEALYNEILLLQLKWKSTRNHVPPQTNAIRPLVYLANQALVHALDQQSIMEQTAVSDCILEDFTSSILLNCFVIILIRPSKEPLTFLHTKQWMWSIEGFGLSGSKVLMSSQHVLWWNYLRYKQVWSHFFFDFSCPDNAFISLALKLGNNKPCTISATCDDSQGLSCINGVCSCKSTQQYDGSKCIGMKLLKYWLSIH